MHTLGTAAWNTKSVMGRASEFVAVIMIDTTLDGLPGTFSNPKFIFKPLFSKAVMDGKPIKRKRRPRNIRSLGCQLINMSWSRINFIFNMVSDLNLDRANQNTGNPLYIQRYHTNLPMVALIVLPAIFSMAWYNIFMQSFLVVYLKVNALGEWIVGIYLHEVH